MARGGYLVGLDLDNHEMFAAFAEDSFWKHVDSQQYPWPDQGYIESRNGACLAAKSDGSRCSQRTPETDPFCAFHMTRALEWFLGRATAEQIRKERHRVNLMATDARRLVADARAIVSAGAAGPRVYFYELVGQGLVKIGTSRRPETRVKQFKSGTGCLFPADCDPSTGRLIGHIAGDMEIERALQGRFRRLRVAGEWFRLTDELANHIDSLLTAERAVA